MQHYDLELEKNTAKRPKIIRAREKKIICSDCVIIAQYVALSVI